MNENQEMFEKLVKGLRGIYGDMLVSILLYGSFARGTNTRESDIDIAIIGENKISDTVDLNLTLELEDFLGRSIDIIDINDEEIENIIIIEALNRNYG